MVMHHAHHKQRVQWPLSRRREDKKQPHAPDVAAIQAWAASWGSLGGGSLCPRRLGVCSCQNRPARMPQRGRLGHLSLQPVSALTPGSWRGLTAQLNGCWVTALPSYRQLLCVRPGGRVEAEGKKQNDSNKTRRGGLSGTVRPGWCLPA